MFEDLINTIGKTKKLIEEGGFTTDAGELVKRAQIQVLDDVETLLIRENRKLEKELSSLLNDFSDKVMEIVERR